MKRTLLAVVVAVFAVGVSANPALAGHCPRDVKRIDQALTMTKVSGAQLSTVKALRDKGDGLHKSGQHGTSVATLHEAMKILGISH